jgi:hypothetical protein
MLGTSTNCSGKRSLPMATRCCRYHLAVNNKGNTVCHELRGCMGCLCHEYDHIIPFSRGGQSVLENCQVLQTRANRFKGILKIFHHFVGNEDNDEEKLKAYSCAKNWSNGELDVLEMAIYGDVKDSTGKPRCRCKSNFELLSKFAALAKMPKKLLNDFTPNCL